MDSQIETPKASPALVLLADKYLEVKKKIVEIELDELKKLKSLADEMKGTIKKQMDREKVEVVSTEVGFVKLSIGKGKFKYIEDLLMGALGISDEVELEKYGKRGKDIHKLTSGFNDTE